MWTMLGWFGALMVGIVLAEVVIHLLDFFIDGSPPLRRPKPMTGKAGTPLPPELLHTSGIAATPLHPSGFAVLDGKRWPARSSGPFIDTGTPVFVVEVRPQILVVRSTDGPEPIQDGTPVDEASR